MYEFIVINLSGKPASETLATKLMLRDPLGTDRSKITSWLSLCERLTRDPQSYIETADELAKIAQRYYGFYEEYQEGDATIRQVAIGALIDGPKILMGVLAKKLTFAGLVPLHLFGTDENPKLVIDPLAGNAIKRLHRSVYQEDQAVINWLLELSPLSAIFIKEVLNSKFKGF